MRFRWTAGLLAVALLAPLCGYLVLNAQAAHVRTPPRERENPSGMAASPGQAHGQDSRVAANRRALRSLNSRISELEGQLRDRPADDESADEQAEDELMGEDPARTGDAAAAGARTYERFQTTLDEEPIDGAWARESEAEVRAAFDTDVLRGERVESFSCRSTVCKLEISHSTQDPSASREAFLDATAHSEAFGGAWWKLHEAEDGHVRTTLFMMRKGHEGDFVID